MEKRTYITNDIEQINIETVDIDIEIIKDENQSSYVSFNDDVIVTSNQRKIEIRQKEKLLNGFKLNIQSGIIQLSDSILLKNCEIINGNIKINSDKNIDVPKIKLSLQKNNDLMVSVKTTSGNINIKDLILKRLSVTTTTGDISLTSFDSYHSIINTISGDINIGVLNSILNYEVELRSIIGSINCEDIIDKLENLSSKKILKANSVTGNIDVKFKEKIKKLKKI